MPAAIKTDRPEIPARKIFTLAPIPAHQPRRQVETMKEAAEWLGLTEEALARAVTKAFLDLVNDDQWITFPLMFSQVPPSDQ